jgi:hypothetical protein
VKGLGKGGRGGTPFRWVCVKEKGGESFRRSRKVCDIAGYEGPDHRSETAGAHHTTDHRDRGSKPAGREPSGTPLGTPLGKRRQRRPPGAISSLPRPPGHKTYMNDDICWTEQSRAAIRRCSSRTRDIAKHGEARNRRYTTQ